MILALYRTVALLSNALRLSIYMASTAVVCSGDLQVSETCVILPVIHMCHSTCYHACLVLSSSRPSPLNETVAATTFLRAPCWVCIIIFPSLVLPLGNVRLISACPGGSANVPASAIGCAMLVFSTFAVSFCGLLRHVGANERCSF